MGEIIIKIPENVKEIIELDLPSNLIKEKIALLKQEAAKSKMKDLINKTFDTLKSNIELEEILEDNWHRQ